MADERERFSPLALIALLLLVLLVLAVFFVSFLIAPLAILVLFYVAFAASDRSKLTSGSRMPAPEPDLAAALQDPVSETATQRAAREAELRRSYRARAEQEAARRPGDG